ncbi:hypothetical protein [Paenibacillus sp. L3-i20]|uniref:hypothetical protein n=1 Tax=Paenibacillus sp. L3-i20 TaxID=2905833 RepID=UPI001EDDA022|nr:hypothetical protein [Paenibacillus sp. L3-i20]GKU79800.1 hypothetical protein L3i20_v241970 [Paenibacillus sp. L3-i20]
MEVLSIFAKLTHATAILQLLLAIYNGITGDLAGMWTSITFAYMNKAMLIFVYGEME